jgi:hypothetical protein
MSFSILSFLQKLQLSLFSFSVGFGGINKPFKYLSFSSFFNLFFLLNVLSMESHSLYETQKGENEHESRDI